jgi:kynurenine formamidase
VAAPDAFRGIDELLASARLVDLTQPLGPATVLWPGSAPFTATTGGTHERDGAYWRSIALEEHSGTHLDAPLHFAAGGRSTAELPLEALVRPAAVLDVRDRVAGTPRYAVSRADVERLEARDGRIAPGVAVLLSTGWDEHLTDPERYAESFPGLAPDSAELLVARGAVGVGIDTLGVDPAGAHDFPVHRITQPAGLWHLEGLVGLHRLPARGAWLVAPPPPLVAGSGAPVRAFAILPGG